MVSMKDRFYSITSYVIISIILVHLAVVPFLYKTITIGYKTSVNEQFVSHITETSGLLSDVLSSYSLHNDKDSIQNILNTSILSGNIQYIRIITTTGQEITPDAPTEISADTFKEDDKILSNNDDIYFLSLPFYFKQHNSISRLQLGFDESGVIQDYKVVEKTVISALVIYLAAIILLTTIVTRFIHKPLHLLRNRSKDIANGNLEIPLDIRSRISEIKLLSHDLEGMRTSLVKLADKMQHKAAHDELTGLPNRYLYNDRLEQTIIRAKRDNRRFATLLLDLNRFKEINDTLGHGIGDEVLVVAARRMTKGLRESDTVARIGGDEFSFILVDSDHLAAEKIARKIINLIEPVFTVNNHSLKISGSIGIAIFPDDGDDAESLLRRADVAMYYAKHNDKQIATYIDDMDSDHLENLMLSNELKNSIEEDHFEALFQPKIDLKTGKPTGCELLLRWHHPNLGIIKPERFVPIAERENLIGQLTSLILKKYIHKLCKLADINKDFHVAINISPIDLLEDSLLSSITSILDGHSFTATNLFIEVTETAIMKNPDRSANILSKYKQAGITISIDDFGTGYSSLAYLQKFPISELKIDKSFVSDLSTDSTNYPIVKATIAMAHDLGINVVAEGVEERDVMELLTSMGCDHVQGYLYTKPLGIDDLISWIETNG